MGLDEAAASRKVAVHAGTPGVMHLDALGRPFLSVVDNVSYRNYVTRTELDV